MDNARVPLGKGIADAQLLVINPANQLVSEGETGEILIRSPYLSRGYWGDPGLTEAKFIANPFTADAADRCYRTGDLGTYLADGSASFLGRADSQVKIRGHRIELACDIGTDEQYAELARVAPLMLEEWSRTKKAPRHADWLHQAANE